MAGNGRTRDPLRVTELQVSLARFERATSALSRGALPMHSSSSPPPNWLWRGTIEIANPPCGGPCGLASGHGPEERDLFTTAKLACRTGEQAKSETPRSLSAARHALYPLSYALTRVSTAGFEPATSSLRSEVTDLFTTGAAIVLSGNGRERFQPRQRRAFLLEPATRQPSRGRLHGT